MSGFSASEAERQDLETYSELPHSDAVIVLARGVATLVAIAAIIVISLIIVFARFLLVSSLSRCFNSVARRCRFQGLR